MNPNQYQAEAQNTKSPDFHTAVVSVERLIPLLRRLCVGAEAIDELKKGVFYGKELSNSMRLKLQAIQPGEFFHLDPPTIDAIHAGLGLMTEGAEILEAVIRGPGSGEELDLTNLKEEGGDCLWYLAILFQAVGTDFETEMARNNAKLRARFPDRFSSEKALERDLELEREVLEDAPS